MTAIYPIKFIRTRESSVYTVEWMIGNTCNYKCVYCGPKYNSGDTGWLSLDVYKQTVDRISSEASNKKVSFRWTGGEPTLYPKLIELMTHVRQRGNYNTIISNGSRTLRWWEDLYNADCTDLIYLTYHAQQTSDYEHIINVVNMFRYTNTMIVIAITCLPEFFDKCLEAFNAFANNCYAIINLTQINDSRSMNKYSEEQKKFLVENSFSNKIDPLHTKKVAPIIVGNMTMYWSDNSETTNNVNYFVRTQQNNFRDWFCDAGKDYIRVEHDKVQRAVCGVGERWSIYDDKLFKDTAVKCSLNKCDCALDMYQSKYMTIE